MDLNGFMFKKRSNNGNFVRKSKNIMITILKVINTKRKH